MKQGAWRTGSPHKYPSPVVKPSGWQLIRQGLILLLIVAVWGGVLAIFANAIASSELVVASVAVPTPLPTAVASPTATTLPATATTVPATATQPATSTRPAATATATSTPTATSTRLAAITAATSTPTVSPTDLSASTEPPATTSPTANTQASFARDVQPIFDRVCVKCHGGDEEKEGMVLKSYAELMAGSDNGPVIAPGDPANSLLIDLITQGKMPKKGPKLLPGEIRAITDWVAAGAANN